MAALKGRGRRRERDRARPEARTRRAAAVIALFLAAIVWSSCGVFDTRDSNPPGGGGSETPRKTPTDMEAVLFNYENAVAYMDQGNYEEALSEDFVFLPDSEDRAFFVSTVGSDIFEDWGRDREMTAIRLIFSDSKTLEVRFDELDRRDMGDTAFVRIDYEFVQTVEGQADSMFYRGMAEIHLKANESGMWSIDRWKDIWKDSGSSEVPTWGRLKGSAVGG